MTGATDDARNGTRTAQDAVDRIRAVVAVIDRRTSVRDLDADLAARGLEPWLADDERELHEMLEEGREDPSLYQLEIAGRFASVVELGWALGLPGGGRDLEYRAVVAAVGPSARAGTPPPMPMALRPQAELRLRHADVEAAHERAEWLGTRPGAPWEQRDAWHTLRNRREALRWLLGLSAWAGAGPGGGAAPPPGPVVG